MNDDVMEEPPIAEPTAIAEYSRTEAALADLSKRFAGVVYAVSTPDGLEAATKARNELRAYRTSLEKTRKRIKEPALRRCQLIDSEAKRIEDALKGLETPIAAQIEAEEKRVENERQEAIRAEQARIEAARIAELRAEQERMAAERAEIERARAELARERAEMQRAEAERRQQEQRRAEEEARANMSLEALQDKVEELTVPRDVALAVPPSVPPVTVQVRQHEQGKVVDQAAAARTEAQRTWSEEAKRADEKASQARAPAARINPQVLNGRADLRRWFATYGQVRELAVVAAAIARYLGAFDE